LGISPLSEKIIEYRNKWKAHLQRMEYAHIPLQAYKYQPSRKRDIDRPRRRWGETQQYYRPEQEILLTLEVMVMMKVFQGYNIQYNYKYFNYSIGFKIKATRNIPAKGCQTFFSKF
jgi:hypothetical protein